MLLKPWFWPRWWRFSVLTNLCLYVLLENAWCAGLAPVFYLIIQELQCTNTEASQLNTLALLMVGMSNIFALPLSSLIGKRYTFLMAISLFLACNIWSGEATTFQSLRTSRILGGLAGGMIEGLGPTLIGETFPNEKLASAMVMYVGCLAGGSAIGPIVAGAIGEGLENWRWFLRIISVALGVNLIGSILMLPDTSHEGTESGEIIPLEDKDSSEGIKAASAEVEEAQQISAPTVLGQKHLYYPLFEEWVARSFSGRYVTLRWGMALQCLIRPFSLLKAPRVLMTAVIFGLSIGWTVITAILTAMIYAQPPLLWSARPIGLLSFAPLIGLMIGLPVGGFLADVLFIRSARNNQGQPNPASRLPAIIPGGLLSPSGCIMIGYGLRNPGTWIVVCVGWGMIGFGLTSSANVLLAYAISSVPSRAEDIGIVVNIVKNVIAFGVGYAGIDWMDSVGTVNQFITMAILLWVAILLVIPIWAFDNGYLRRPSFMGRGRIQ